MFDISLLTQPMISGGSNTPPEARLFLYSLATMAHARDIVETGYDAGYTTLALAQVPGARVVGIDNGSEYPDVKGNALTMLAPYSNVRLVQGDALVFLRGLANASLDFIFIDDFHGLEHVERELIEVKRVLRPGGHACFHDTISCGLGPLLDRHCADWPHISYLPCPSPYAGGEDYGLGVVQKPKQK